MPWQPQQPIPSRAYAGIGDILKDLQHALKLAEDKNERAIVRRLQRSIESLKQMAMR